MILIQNEGRPYTAALTQKKKMEQLGWKTIEHSSVVQTYYPATLLSSVRSKKFWKIKGSTTMLRLKPIFAFGPRHNQLHVLEVGEYVEKLPTFVF